MSLTAAPGGALITTLTGIEIALWDLKGKALGVPLVELMGGKFRDKIWVYADCEVDPGMDFDQIKQVVDDVMEQAVLRRSKLTLTSAPIARAAPRRLMWSRIDLITPPARSSTNAWSNW